MRLVDLGNRCELEGFMTTAPFTHITGLRSYLCVNCHTPGVSVNPNRKYCERRPCQEAKRKSELARMKRRREKV